MSEKYDRSVSLQCPTCGGEMFEIKDNDENVCQRCNLPTSKEAILAANSERIQGAIDDIKSEFAADVRREFSKIAKIFK